MYLNFGKVELIQFSFVPNAMMIRKSIKKGYNNLLKKGGQTETLLSLSTSKIIGYIVPISTTDKKYIINQLFIIIDVSLLSKNDFLIVGLSLT